MASPYALWREGFEASVPFVVCAMFTPGYHAKAERLAASLNAFGLAHAIFEAPQVHRSISPRGGAELDFSKPRFIRFALEHFAKPVLYVDADVIFRKNPDAISALCGRPSDFAIYNWLADPMSDAWRPEPGTPLWKFYFSVDAASDSQLMASGAVQFWKNTGATQVLLKDWENALMRHPAQRRRSLPGLCLQSWRPDRPQPGMAGKGICPLRLLDLCRSGDRPSGISRTHHRGV